MYANSRKCPRLMIIFDFSMLLQLCEQKFQQIVDCVDYRLLFINNEINEYFN